MKSQFIYTAMICAVFFGFMSCRNVDRGETHSKVELKAQPFELKDVKLLDGPFLRATELNVASLLRYEPDRFLAKFRMEAGLEPRAEPYSGWEGQSLAGHSLGHYLSACALMYQTTRNPEFLARVNYIVSELALVQEANGGGYIGAFSRTSIDEQNIGTELYNREILERGQWVFENEIAKGIIVSAPFSLNGIWAPFYTHHKVLAGLRDAYLLTGNQQALDIALNFADWIYSIVEPLNHEQVQEMLVCEYGGINEVFAEFYGITGEEKYLRLSRIFHDEAVLGPLALEQDRLSGLHANTQIPKVTGLARRYELTGNQSDYVAATFFWHTVVNYHTYVTGGNCNEEYFGDPGILRDRLGPNTTETCNVYNMLRLTKRLFLWEPKALYIDYYERALINHIKASQHPVDGRVIYNLTIEMGGRKHFQNPFGFTCCVGTGMENHSRYGEAIYFHNENELFIAQFIASELTWKEKGVVLRQETQFPEAQSSKISVSADTPVRFRLNIRKPHWAVNNFQILVNGNPIRQRVTRNGFVSVNRTWRTGDTVEILFPFFLRLENMPDDVNRVAIFNGPVLLAGILGPQDDPNVTEFDYVPVLLTNDRNPENWLEATNVAMRFRTLSGFPRNVELMPFYKIFDKRYTVFWDMMSKEQYQEKLQIYNNRKAFEKQLDSVAFAIVIPGSETEVQQWNLQGERTSVRRYNERLCRDAERGGWFSFEMGVSESLPVSLVIEYWGGFEGSRTFDIIVEGQIIATENISNKKSGHFILVNYEIPQILTSGKRRVNVLFRPHDFNRAGPIFSLRMVPTDFVKNSQHVMRAL